MRLEAKPRKLRSTTNSTYLFGSTGFRSCGIGGLRRVTGLRSLYRMHSLALGQDVFSKEGSPGLADRDAKGWAIYTAMHFAWSRLAESTSGCFCCCFSPPRRRRDG